MITITDKRRDKIKKLFSDIEARINSLKYKDNISGEMEKIWKRKENAKTNLAFNYIGFNLKITVGNYTIEKECYLRENDDNKWDLIHKGIYSRRRSSFNLSDKKLENEIEELKENLIQYSKAF